MTQRASMTCWEWRATARPEKRKDPEMNIERK
jgi:hypothetical protein